MSLLDFIKEFKQEIDNNRGMPKIRTQEDFDLFVGQLYTYIASEVERKTNEVYVPKHIANFCKNEIVREKNNNGFKYYYSRLGKPRIRVAITKNDLSEEFEKQIKLLFK